MVLFNDVAGGQEGLWSQLDWEVAGPWTNCSSCLRINLVENLRSFCLLIAACTVRACVCMHRLCMNFIMLQLQGLIFRLEGENSSF